MTTQTRATLKSYFNTGDQPTEAQFADLIDSAVNVLDDVDPQLKEWTEGEDYELTAATYDADNVITTATVKWPDASGGTFTTVTKDATWLAINAYTITHTVASKTVTQDAVTRDASGNVTVKPALMVGATP